MLFYLLIILSMEGPSFEFRLETARLLMELDPSTETAVHVSLPGACFPLRSLFRWCDCFFVCGWVGVGRGAQFKCG